MICPNSDRKLRLNITGAELLAVDNADVLAHDTTHKSMEFSTYQGRMVAYIRRTPNSAKVSVTVTDKPWGGDLSGSISY